MTEEAVLAPGYVTIPGFVNQISDSLYQMQQQGLLCDVRLQGENGYVMAHAPILSAASPFLKRMFTQTERRMENPLTGRSVDELQNFVRLIYTGRLFLTFSNASKMSTLLHRLEIHDIANIIQEYCKVEDERSDHKARGVKRKRDMESSHERVIESDTGLQSKVVYVENTNEGLNAASENIAGSDYGVDSDCSYHSEDEEHVVNKQEDVSMEIEGNLSEIISAAQADELNGSPNFLTSSRIEPVEEVVENDENSDNVNIENENASKSDKGGDGLCNSSVNSGKETLQLFTVELEKSPEDKNASKQSSQTRSSPRLTQNQSSSNQKGKKDLRYVIIKKGEIVGREIASTTNSEDNTDRNNSSMAATQEEEKTETSSTRTRSAPGQKTMFCSKCNRMFRKLPYLIQHEKGCQVERTRKRDGDLSMSRQKETCGHCDYSTGVECLMVRHKYLKHGIDFDRKKYKVFECQFPECKFFQMTQELLTDHIKTEHLGLPSETVNEEEEITPEDDLASETILEEEEEVETPETAEPLSSKEGVYDICMFHCPLCGDYFLDKNSLEGCNYFHLQESQYKQHVLDKHGEANYTCEKCGIRLSSKSRLKQHEISHVPKDKRNLKHECVECKLSFRYKSMLRQHIKIKHEKQKPFLCHLCPFKTAYRREMDIHLHKIHEVPVERQKYHCTFCDYFSFLKRDMEAHINRHNGVRDFVCEVCGASFTSKNGLVGHSARHKEKIACPYEGCTYMGSNQVLKKHIQHLHTNKDDRPFCCRLCGFKTKTSAILNKHLENQHKVEVVTKNKLFEQMMRTGEGYEAVAQQNRLEVLERVTQGHSNRYPVVVNAPVEQQTTYQLQAIDVNPSEQNVAIAGQQQTVTITGDQNLTIGADGTIHGNIIVDGLNQVITGDGVGTLEGENIILISTQQAS